MANGTGNDLLTRYLSQPTVDNIEHDMNQGIATQGIAEPAANTQNNTSSHHTDQETSRGFQEYLGRRLRWNRPDYEGTQSETHQATPMNDHHHLARTYSLPGAHIGELPTNQASQFGPVSSYPNTIEIHQHYEGYGLSPDYSPSAPQQHLTLGPQSRENATNQGPYQNQTGDPSLQTQIIPPQNSYSNSPNHLLYPQQAHFNQHSHPGGSCASQTMNNIKEATHLFSLEHLRLVEVTATSRRTPLTQRATV